MVELLGRRPQLNPSSLSNLLATGGRFSNLGGISSPGMSQLARFHEFEDLDRQLARENQPDPTAGIRSQLESIISGLPQQFSQENFLSGFNARQLPALAGARQALEAAMARRGLTGSGAELSELRGLEAGAATERTKAESDFLLQRPGLQLGALSQAADILRSLPQQRNQADLNQFALNQVLSRGGSPKTPEPLVRLGEPRLPAAKPAAPPIGGVRAGIPGATAQAVGGMASGGGLTGVLSGLANLGGRALFGRRR